MKKIRRNICINEEIWNKIRIYSVENKVSISSLVEKYFIKVLKEKK